jgi:hypothetical protein
MSKEAERLQAINAVLSLWRGEQAQFWTYTAALACLEIRLFSTQRPGSVHLVCSPCLWIMGPVFWEQCVSCAARSISSRMLSPSWQRPVARNTGNVRPFLRKPALSSHSGERGRGGFALVSRQKCKG